MSTTTASTKNPVESISPTDVPLDALPVIELSRKQIEKAVRVAQSRNQSYDAIDGGVVFGEHNALQSHVIGVLGELAVAQFFDTTLDERTYTRGDDGFDVTLWGEIMTIDVKTTATTKMNLPQLLVRADKSLKADLYVCTHVIECDPEGARVRLIGYAPQELVAHQDPEPHPGSTKNYVVDPNEMSLLPFVQDHHSC